MNYKVLNSMSRFVNFFSVLPPRFELASAWDQGISSGESEFFIWSRVVWVDGGQ